MKCLTIAFLNFKIRHGFHVCITLLIPTVFRLRHIWLRTFQWGLVKLMTVHIILPNQLIYLVNILKFTLVKKFFDFGVVLIHVIHIVYKALVDTATDGILCRRLKGLFLLLDAG